MKLHPHLSGSIRMMIMTLIIFIFTFSKSPVDKPLILVFSKTDGFRHTSIEAGKAAFQKMADEKGFSAEFSEDAAMFTTSNLKRFRAVVFLNTTGNILNEDQQGEFERYIQSGGGYLGIHGATDCEYEWPWYGKLAGAFFLDHPNPDNIQKGKFHVTEKNHWATEGMPDEFEHTDEFYSFKSIDPTINVLVKIDEKSYQGGRNGDDHPMIWYHDFDGGRSFYTAMGHTEETYSEPLFLNHVWAGLHYVMGGDSPGPLDYSKAKPEENRFSKVILKEKLNEPMELSVLNDGRILFIERHGTVRIYNTRTKILKTIATIPVSTKDKGKEGKVSEAEDALLGLNRDPDFAVNHWIYLYYSAPAKSENVLARFTLTGDVLDLTSKKILLTVPVQREQCCHTGGSIAWDKQGNLYLSTGDNTSPRENNYAPIDEREGKGPWDAQKSSANTNDLRGKIIRIKPLANGTYAVPEGNLFAKGVLLTKPEIYTMGHRNPFRISVDQKTGFLYWGEVGPDANDPDSLRGPSGLDEVGQAREAGNYGWPYFVGDNKAYRDFDYVLNQTGPYYDADKPVNKSPNNTGLNELPPARKALIWYPYAESKEFPLVGSGGRNAMAGPVFYSENFKSASRSFPKYYDGKLLIYDWMRGWIMAVTMDKSGNYQSMERFMPSYKFSNPMDMEFDSKGDLYMLEYGTGWFTANDDARLIRIEYNGGNRKPLIQVNADKLGGAIPFHVALTSAGTMDVDHDPLTYSWSVTSKSGFSKIISGPDASLLLTKPEVYKATLTVSDGKGGISSQSLEMIAGNELPSVSFDLGKSNKTFYAPDKLYNYSVKVEDKEDGSLENGKIRPESVIVNIDYLPEGFDKTEIARGHRTAESSMVSTRGLRLIESGDCKTCHSIDKKSIGPGYRDVSLKYKGKAGALENLTKKIISGGSGVWGDVPMAAHPQLTSADASEMVKYILSLSDDKPKVKSLPVKGTYITKTNANDKGQGVYIFRAAYKDRGAFGLAGLASEETFALRSPVINPSKYDLFADVNKMSFNGNSFVMPNKNGSYVGLSQIDLTGIVQLNVTAAAPKAQANALGGFIELYVDSPQGKMIGKSEFIGDVPGGVFSGKPVSIGIETTEGVHDFYLVFQNPEMKSAQIMMVVLNTEFKLEGEAKIAASNVTYTADELATYAGKYKMDGLPFPYIEVSLKDGKLIMDAGGQAGPINPTPAKDKFDADGRATITFLRENQKVSRLSMEAMGFRFEGVRE